MIPDLCIYPYDDFTKVIIYCNQYYYPIFEKNNVYEKILYWYFDFNLHL